jgi:hypothetical protein
MITVDPNRLITFREQTFHLIPGNRLASPEEAVEFINQRGFAFFWPIKGTDLPSLWVAAAGDRPVPDEHDDPGHVTWGWKDGLLDKRVWYYARLLRRRNTIVSLDAARLFYALSPNYGDPQNDYQEQYELGRLTLEAKQMYEALLREGPLHTITLRKAARMTSPESEYRFNRALDTLQIEMKILPVGVAQAGAWRYAFIYDLVPHHFPSLPVQARAMSEAEARRQLIRIYFQSVGIARPEQIQRLFGWRSEDTHRAIQYLIDRDEIIADVQISQDDQSRKQKTGFLVLPQLIIYNK